MGTNEEKLKEYFEQGTMRGSGSGGGGGYNGGGRGGGRGGGGYGGGGGGYRGGDRGYGVEAVTEDTEEAVEEAAMAASSVVRVDTWLGIVLKVVAAVEVDTEVVVVEENGCSPNNVTYNIFIRGFLRTTKTDVAIPILEEILIRMDFSLDADTMYKLVNYRVKSEDGDSYLLDLI